MDRHHTRHLRYYLSDLKETLGNHPTPMHWARSYVYLKKKKIKELCSVAASNSGNNTTSGISSASGMEHRNPNPDRLLKWVRPDTVYPSNPPDMAQQPTAGAESLLFFRTQYANPVSNTSRIKTQLYFLKVFSHPASLPFSFHPCPQGQPRAAGKTLSQPHNPRLEVKRTRQTCQAQGAVFM